MSPGAGGAGGKRGGTRGGTGSRTQRTRRGTTAGEFSGRSLKKKVRTAKGRSTSSSRWLQRQLSDPYVEEAQRRGYRARSAFKLAQMDDKLRLIRRGARVVDLGAAPGSWSQLAVERAGAGAQVVGIDLEEVEPLAGARFLVGDVRELEAAERLRAALAGPADLVMSDLAAAATGHGPTDHLRTMALVEAALDIAEALLAPGGAFVAKVLQGGTEAGLLARLKRGFKKVQHVKPPASRKDSAELYVVATGFRGPGADRENRTEPPAEDAPENAT
jgi:23S rRNA (uridine2552-2'-O)-methyltransferase